MIVEGVATLGGAPRSFISQASPQLTEAAVQVLVQVLVALTSTSCLRGEEL